MENTWKVSLGVFLLICFVATAEAIKCFQCSSAEDPKCADLKQNDTKSKYYRECSDSFGLKPFFCRKTSMLLLESKVTRVTRSCGTIINKGNETNCYRADTDFKSEISCQCFSDGCNSVSASKPSVIAIFVLGILAICYANI